MASLTGLYEHTPFLPSLILFSFYITRLEHCRLASTPDSATFPIAEASGPSVTVCFTGKIWGILLEEEMWV